MFLDCTASRKHDVPMTEYQVKKEEGRGGGGMGGEERDAGYLRVVPREMSYFVRNSTIFYLYYFVIIYIFETFWEKMVGGKGEE